MIENDWYEQEVFCINKQLCQKFDGFNLNFVKNTDSRFFLSTCESLVANNGSILLSSNQIKEKKLKELPPNFVIFATTSQLVDTISEGLRIIKSQSSKHIPSNITTIQDFETDKEKDFMSYGSSTKNLYLLLLEDL
jgi:L-lactate utilization protein LutB